jgi:hypothetical protein
MKFSRLCINASQSLIVKSLKIILNQRIITIAKWKSIRLPNKFAII